MFSIPMALLRRELNGPDFFLVGLFPGMISDCGESNYFQKLCEVDYLCRIKIAKIKTLSDMVNPMRYLGTFKHNFKYLLHV